MVDLPALVETLTPWTCGVSVGAIALELVVLRIMGVATDRREGRASVVSGVLAFGGLALANRLFFVGAMDWVWDHRLLDLGSGALAFVAAFVLYDALFWVAHWAGHRVRLLWCFHSVHHSSEQMRLSAAIRGSAGDFIYLPWFFVWLPILGIDPLIVLLVEAAGRIWGVLTHVHPRLVGQLGVLDRVLVTPTVHRVHHGRNADYIDTNYGEVLTVWDHVFGTYQAHTEPPDYGLLTRPDPGSVVQIQLGPWRALWRDVRAATSLGDRLRCVFGPPGWSPDG
jgi:sterol desaturase/sphingolipid hydroxylase (fatty acid hydroxylase superfamily)